LFLKEDVMLRIIATTCVLGLLASPAAMAGQADLILAGAKVLTGDSNRPTAEAVALAGERIRAVGSNDEIRRLAGPRTRVVDLRGRTVIAGLIDAHVHLLGAPEIVDEPSLRNFKRTTLPKVMTGLISHGITTVRSTGDPLPYIAQLRDRLERGQLVGPRLLITGPTLSSPGGLPTMLCRDNPFCRQGTREIESEEQARQVVRELSRAKVDAVKVVVDDYFGKVPPLSDAVISALVDETHRAGLRILAHVAVTKDVVTARRLLELGVDEFVHLSVSGRNGARFALVPINDLSLPNPAEVSQIASMLVARNIPVTTTVSNGDAYRDTTGVERILFGGSPPYTPAMRQHLEWVLSTVREFADAGVKLVVGTDAGLPPPSNSVVRDDPRLQPGARTLHEMKVLHRAGLPTPAILTAATRNGAEALGIIDKVGTIAEGKLADLVVLDGDFLQDFSALHRTVAVLKGGRVVHGTLPER
jgi:imidazolonepropionase-like amidohydrolase